MPNPSLQHSNSTLKLPQTRLGPQLSRGTERGRGLFLHARLFILGLGTVCRRTDGLDTDLVPAGERDTSVSVSLRHGLQLYCHSPRARGLPAASVSLPVPSAGCAIPACEIVQKSVKEEHYTKLEMKI